MTGLEDLLGTGREGEAAAFVESEDEDTRLQGLRCLRCSV